MAQFIWKKLHYDAAQTTIMHYWFGQAFFYFQVSNDGFNIISICCRSNVNVHSAVNLRFQARTKNATEKVRWPAEGVFVCQLHEGQVD